MEKFQVPHTQKPSRGKKTKESILVIDDSADTLILQRLVLELEGFEVFTAQTGEEAFGVLSEIDEPDLILLDMQMEDMTGLDFLTMLEEKMPKIMKAVPVVFLSGVNEVPESKAAGFIRKPTDSENFLVSVHDFIEIGHHSPYKH